jgi:hypothetical protein
MERLEELFHWPHHHHHHKARLCAPHLSQISIKEISVPTKAIVGTQLPSVDLTITLPTTRVDGSAATPAEIQSATILRDAGDGQGPVPLTTVSGPFGGPTATFTDVQPATGTDIYSFFCTDTAGTVGLTSLPVTVSVSGAAKAQLSAGTITAVAQGSGTGGTGTQAATPTFSPVAGAYVGAQNVAIASTDAGAVFNYTVDGSVPTTASTVYSGPVAVGSSLTLQAISTVAGVSSAVASAAYVIS